MTPSPRTRKNTAAPLFRRLAGCALAFASSLLSGTALSAEVGGKTIQSIGEQVTKGVGMVANTNPEGPRGPVYLIEEVHSDRVDQIRIATMLVRLYSKAGVRTVGLEGMMRGAAPLPAREFLAGADAQARRETLKLLLRKMEISGVEYAGAVLPELAVVGIENPDEYAAEMKGGDTHPISSALLEIAEKILPQQTLARVYASFEDTRLAEEKRGAAAIEILKAANPWLRERFLALDKAEELSSAQLAAEYRAVLDKAESSGVSFSREMSDALNSARTFFEVADKRSVTMAESMLALAESKPGTPLALVVGGSHTERITEKLRANHVSYSVLHASGFREKSDAYGIQAYRNQSLGLWADDQPGSLGSLLNVQPTAKPKEKKNPPLIGSLQREGYASAHKASVVVARAVRSGEKSPAVLMGLLKDLPGITVDPESFRVLDPDVVFSLQLPDTSGAMQTIWIRAGTRNAVAKTEEEIEEELKRLAEAEKEALAPEEKPLVAMVDREVAAKFFRTAGAATNAKVISER